MGYCSVCGKEIEQVAGMCEECKSKSYQNEDYMDALLQDMGTIEDDSLRAFKEKIANKSAFKKSEEAEVKTEPEMPRIIEPEPIEVTEIEDLPDMNIDDIPELDIEDLSGLDMDELTDMAEDIPELELGNPSDIAASDDSLEENMTEYGTSMDEVPDIGIDLPEYVDKSDAQETDEAVQNDMNLEDMLSDMNVEDVLNMTSDMDNIADNIPDVDIDNITDSIIDAGAESVSDTTDMNIEDLPDLIPEMHMDNIDDEASVDQELVDEETAGTETEVLSEELPEISMEEDIGMDTDNEQSNDLISEADVQQGEETVDDVLDEMMNMESKGDALEAMFENSANMGDENGDLDDVNMDEFDLDSLLEATDDIDVPSMEDMMNAEGQNEIDALLADDSVQEIDDSNSDISSSDSDDIDLEDIDLMSLLSGDDDGLEMLDEDMLEVDEGSDTADSSSGSKSQTSASSGESVLIDNDLLSIDSDGQNVGDVLSDALSALSPGQNEGNNDDVTELLDNSKDGSKKKKKKAGRFSKLFGNIVDEKEIQKAKEEKESEEAAKKQKEEDAQKKKEQAEIDKQAKKEAKEARAKEKAEKKQVKAAEKQAKKEEKALKALEEENEIEGRINKAGAAIVFFVLGLMAVFIFFGTKMFSYSNSIKNAQTYFDNGQYAESYKELLGVDIKESEQVLYQKVVTVMHVYKQLEAYDVYYKESKYPEALDSLLKGVREYQKYLPDAVELDISSDFESVKSQIVREMEAEFGITEDMAKEINGITDSVEYSRRVYDLAQHLASTGL